MKRIRQTIINLKDRLDDSLRRLCGSLTPEKRIITVVAMVSVFAIVNFYMIFHAIYSIGREDAQRELIEITPITVPDFIPSDSLSGEDDRGMDEFINPLNSLIDEE